MAAVVLHPFDVDDLIGRLSDRATLDLEVLHLSQIAAQGLHRVRTDLWREMRARSERERGGFQSRLGKETTKEDKRITQKLWVIVVV